MDPGQAIFETLRDSSAVGALCGDRIYPGRAPQNATRPHVIYQRIGSNNDPAHGMQDGLRTDLWQVTCTSVVSMLLAQSLADAVRTALHARAASTSLGASPFILEDEIEDVEEPTTGSEVPKYRIVQTYTLLHRGSI